MPSDLVPSELQTLLAHVPLDDLLRGVQDFVADLGKDVLKEVLEKKGTASAHWFLRKMSARLKTAKERAKNEGVASPQPVSPSLALPLIEGAVLEERPEIVDLWERLLAAAMDPARAGAVRARFVEILKQLDPIDALVLNNFTRCANMTPGDMRHNFASVLQLSDPEIEVSFLNLIRLEVMFAKGQPQAAQIRAVANVELSAIGKELMRILKLP